MKKYFFIILLAFGEYCYGMCISRGPEHHSFTMKVLRCQTVTFGADLLDNQAGHRFKVGVMVSGRINNNNYDWKGVKKAPSFFGWKDESYKSIFIDGDADKVCKKIIQKNSKEIALEKYRRCCDTIPKDALCLVPLPVAKIVN